MADHKAARWNISQKPRDESACGATRSGCRLWRTGVGVRISRVVPVVLAALSLGGCLRDPYVSTATYQTSGSWKIERTHDRIANAPVSSALTTTDASNSNVAFTRPAMMQLMCFIDKPVVNFRFQFKVGTDYNSFIGYRFDEKPGHEIGGKFIANANSVAIEDPADVSRFIADMADSKLLYIRIRSFNAGRTTAEFKVDGAPAAITAAYASCPVKVPPPPSQRPAPQASRSRISSR